MADDSDSRDRWSIRDRMCDIYEKRCMLCRFRFNKGEPALLVLPSWELYGPFPFPFDGRVPREIVESFPITTPYSANAPRFLKGFHTSCHSLCNPSLNPSIPPKSQDVFLQRYRWRLESFEADREKRIRDPLAQRLKNGILQRLPLELCRMVAEHLTRECAAVTLQEIARKANLPPPDQTVDIHQDLYATYVNIEGLMYIQALSNTAATDDDNPAQRILRVRHNETIRKVRIGWDRLGVRSISIASPQDESRPKLHHPGGVLWTEYEIKEGESRLMTVSDGLKLRRVQSFEPTLRSNLPSYWRVRRISWPDPLHTSKIRIPQAHLNEAPPISFGESPLADDEAPNLVLRPFVTAEFR